MIRGKEMIPYLIEALGGLFVLLFAVILWFVSKRFSVAMLCITAVLFCFLTAMRTLDYFKLFVLPASLRTSTSHTIVLLVICSFVVTLIAFIRDEKRKV